MRESPQNHSLISMNGKMIIPGDRIICPSWRSESSGIGNYFPVGGCRAVCCGMLVSVVFSRFGNTFL